MMELESALSQMSAAATQREVARQAQQMERGELSTEEICRCKLLNNKTNSSYRYRSL